MMGPAFLIGLGSTGVQVLARVRQLLEAGGIPDKTGTPLGENSRRENEVKEVRLLAFDLLRPRLDTTGRLGASHYFLVSLPPVHEANLSARRTARQTLLKDLRRGTSDGGGSQVLRGLNLNLDALRAGRVQGAQAETVDIFLVTSSFGSTGTGMLVDVAYLCRYLAQNRLPVRLHAVLVAPEAYQQGQGIHEQHYLQNFTLLKELEFLQATRSWATPYPLYGGKSLAGIPGQLEVPPFDTVQVVDGYQLNTGPEAGVVAAVAEGLLCQIDSQARQALAEIRQAHPAQGRNCFSTFGVFSFYRPSHLLRARTIQRAITAVVETIFPIQKNELTGRPEAVAARTPLRPDDPYGNLTFWLSLAPLSGVVEDILQEAGLPSQARHPDRLHFLDRMVRRTRTDWEALLLEAGQAGDGKPMEKKDLDLQRLSAEHVRVLLKGIARRLVQADDRLGPLSMYLEKLDTALTHYLEDLDQVESIWKGLGEHSESDAVRKTWQEAQREVEERRSSNWSKLFSQSMESAQQRLKHLDEQREQMRQREDALHAVRKSAQAMRVICAWMLEIYHYYAEVAALSGSSLFNAAMDEGLLVERQVRFEHGVRAQQIVSDATHDARQMRALLDHFSDNFFKALHKYLDELADTIEWEGAAIRPTCPVALEGVGSIDLADTSTPVEERARQLWHGMSRQLETEIMKVQLETGILPFLSYHEQRGDQLAVTLSERSILLARMIVEPPAQEAILFAPEPEAFGATPHTQAFVNELQHHFTSIYLAQSRDPDRLALFRWGPSLSIDNFFTYHQSAPKKIDPAELRDYVLW
jgi:hypothetical protein